MGKAGMFTPLPGAGAARGRRGRGEWRSLCPVPSGAPPAPEAHPTLGKPAAVWEYRTASGELAGYVLRFDTRDGGKEIRPLSFSEHTATKAREWRWKALEPPRPLYHLERLATRPDAPVVVCEGEKAVDAASRLLPDHVVVASFGGSKGASKSDWTPLRRRRVVVWPDADEPGWEYAAAAARCLAVASADVSIVSPPSDVPEGWDAADAEAEGWDHARALALVEAAAPSAEAMRGEHGCAGGSAADGDVEKSKTKSGGTSPPQRNLIIEAIGDVELWHSPDREAFASVPVNGHVENWGVRSRDFRTWLAGRYFALYGGAAGGQAVQDALALVEAKAIHRGPCHPTWRRVAGHNGAIYHDLCDDAWRAVEISADGWRVVDRPPVKFLRSAAMRPLPEPEAGELIDGLRGFVNVEIDADFQLLVSWLVAGLRPDGPYPIMVLSGEQGSAKSTIAKLLRSLLDPSVALIRSAPRDEHDLFIAAYNNWCISLDNLSKVAWWLSDALCRLSTGGGYATRELHSDRNEVVLDAMRPIILNGIESLAKRPDLGDRALVITLPAIGEDARQTEAEFWGAFGVARPGILAALYDAVSCGLRRQGEVKLSRKLRMADFAQWIEAASPGLGWEPESFNRAYAENQATAVRVVVEDDPVAHAIRTLAAELDYWEGAATDLLPLVNAQVSETTKKQRSWPTTASALGGALARLAPALRAVGVDLRFERRGKYRRRMWIIRHNVDEGSRHLVDE